MKEASFWKPEGENVRCFLCGHHCIIPNLERGFCAVRENRAGILYSLNYGKIIAAHVDPIEKKPLYHFYPGSAAYSIASVGCNFRCSFCQNWNISQMPRDNEGQIAGRDMSPDEVVSDALANDCKSIAYTYTEPTVWYEFARDCGVIAHKNKLKNVFVSNGYMGVDVIDDARFMDAANIDLKSFNDRFYHKTCGGSIQPVLDSLRYMKKKKIWLEVTTLIVPKENDKIDELTAIAKFIADELDPDTPWHISAFHPDYKMTDRDATSSNILKTAYKIGKDAGLNYVYVGNAQVDVGRNTACPRCGKILILRDGFDVTKNKLNKNKCPTCGHKIAGHF